MAPVGTIILRPLLVAGALAQTVASARGAVVRREWLPNQINITMCVWEQPRAAVLRDTLYLDGGWITYRRGLADGTEDSDTPEEGEFMYTIDFTRPFSTAQNVSDVIQKVPKTAGAGNNRAPNYYDGTIFANDHELCFYGGLLRDSEAYGSYPSSTTVVAYERFQYGPFRERWSPGFIDGALPQGMTRYITAGAGVNVPSENLGFYFGGLRRADWGDIRDRGRDEFNATVAADTLISVDMSIMREEKWANESLPQTVSGRANAELVWIPTADRGLLVALGGVVDPAWVYSPDWSGRADGSARRSSTFMSNVSVYDIESRTWYTQPTTGEVPPQLTRFCSVVAAAKDRSSFNVYIYGGYNARNRTDAPSDDVYILSIPSFVWIRAYSGQSAHGRRSHRCAMVYPDQMLVVGGQPQQTGSTCLEGGLIQIFNLNTLQWQDRYDPKTWAEYQVPAVVTDEIGGNADGSASVTEPSEWGDAALGALFRTRYTKTIPTHYPYSSTEIGRAHV